MNKKYRAALAATALVASSLFAVTALADTTAPVTMPTNESKEHGENMRPMGRRVMGERSMIGTVASVNGTSLTVTVKERMKKDDTAAQAVTYTVDISKAVVIKNGANSTPSSIAVG